MRSIVIWFTMIAVAATGGSLLCRPSQLVDFEIEKFEVLQFNQIGLDLKADGIGVGIDLNYPRNRIYLGDVSGPGVVLYEECYKSLDSSIDVSLQPLQPFTNFGKVAERSEGNVVEFGYLESVVYRLEVEDNNQNIADTVLRSVVEDSSMIGNSFFPRASAEQFIDGEWRKLTTIRFGGMGYVLAPQDTIRIRLKFGAMSVKYFWDRIVVQPAAKYIQEDAIFRVERPVVGYWPQSVNAQDVFRDYEMSRVDFGEWWTFEYPVKPPTRMYTFDVFVVVSGKQYAVPLVVTVLGPNFMVPGSLEGLSTWPLLPTRELVDGNVGDSGGYPGGLAVPKWAAYKLFELGRGFSATNETNRQLYWDENYNRK